MSMIIDGTNGLTFNNSTTQASAGNVLQVVQASTSTPASTSSDSMQTSGLSVSITPKFSTSKILIFVNACGDTAASNSQIALTIYRGATNLASSTTSFENNYGAGSRIIAPMSLCYLDSPATTSSTTYTPYFSHVAGSTAGTVTFNAGAATGGSIATITVMEIAA
jgi:hypothetical protein